MAKTIEDYKKDYELARANGDAAGMQAANDGANALRAASGQQLEYATVDINKTANANSGSSSGKVTGNTGSNINYTPANASSGSHIDYDTYVDEVKKQQSYIDKTGSSTPYTTEDYQKLYGDIYNSAKETTPADRTSLVGSSGADEGLLSSGDYAVIQKLKQDFADAQTGYKQAVAAGNTALAAQYQQAMDNAHLAAEKVRAGYNYSGGSDGSMYIDYAVQAAAGNMSQNNTKQTQDLLKSKGLYDYGEDDTGLSAVGSGSGSGSGGTSSGGGSTSSGGTAGSLLEVPEAESLRNYVNDYSSYLEQLYAAQKEAALAELKNAYEKNINAINAAGEQIDSTYQTARNQTAGASELAARNFNEYAAANGLNSGAGGQAELARNVTLQNNLNSLNSEEAQAISDLELQRANAETEYNNAIAQAEAEGNYQLAAALYQEKIRYDEQMVSAIQQEYQNALSRYQLQYQQQRDLVSDSQWQQSFDLQANQWQQDFDLQKQQYADSLSQWQQSFNLQQQQYADNQAQQKQEALAQYGKAYLQQGIMPSTEMLDAMGITMADAQAYINSLKAESSVSSSVSSGNSGGAANSGGAGAKLTWDDVETWVSMYGAESADNYIKEHYKDLGYSSATTAIAGWNNHLMESGGLTGTSETDGTMVSFARGIYNRAKLKYGETQDAINALIDELVGTYGYSMTQVNEILGKLGL